MFAAFSLNGVRTRKRGETANVRKRRSIRIVCSMWASRVSLCVQEKRKEREGEKAELKFEQICLGRERERERERNAKGKQAQ